MSARKWAIIGAGPVGGTAACHLAWAGEEVAVVEIKDDLATALQGFAFQWTAPAEYTGPFNIGVRSLGDQDMNVDKIQFYLGDTILGFALNRDDVGKIIDYETGKEDGYTRGAWDGTTVKISTIST